MMIPGLKEVIQAINRLAEAVEKATIVFQEEKQKQQGTNPSIPVHIKEPCKHMLLVPMINQVDKLCMSCAAVIKPVVTTTSVVQVDPEKQPTYQASQTSTQCQREGHEWPTPVKLGANCTRCGERMMSGREQSQVCKHVWSHDWSRCVDCGFEK